MERTNNERTIGVNMSLGHGIIFGGMQEREDNGDRRIHLESQKDEEKPVDSWPGIKRAPGAHRIATHLREEGYDIEVIDFWPAWTQEQLHKLLEDRIRDDTLFIAVSAIFPNGGAGENDQKHAIERYNIWKELKNEFGHKCDFISGAQNVSAIIGYQCDYYFAGYGEKAITEYCKMKRGLEHDLIIRKRTYYGAERNVIECRHDHPAFPWTNAHIKYEDRDYIQPDEILSIELSRGCRFQCKFCSFSVLGVKGDYTRCEESVYQELLENYERWGTTVYTLTDETVNDYTEKLEKFAKVIGRLPFKPHLQGFIRGDLMAHRPQDWGPMWDMGLWSHFYGIETLNDQAGKYVGKGMKSERIKEGLVAAREWFQHPSRGLYKSTIAFILGLPHETPETFIDGIRWMQENMPRQSVLFSPLMITQNETRNMMTNPSIFEKTALSSGVFKETNNEEMGVDYDEIPESMRRVVKFYMEADGVLKWKHDTFNIWEAWKLFADLATQPSTAESVGPGIFYYHRYVTGGINTIEDMTKTFKEIEPYGLRHLKVHRELIDNYIARKLG